jgi:DNA-binding transcriptional LysR family regulator
MVRTARADELAEPLRQILQQARALLDPEAVVDPSRLRRPFRLVCTDHVSTVLLPEVEHRLRRDAPQVDLYVLPLVPETMDDLRRGLIDAAIGVFPDAPPEVRSRRLFDDQFVTVCRRDHPRWTDSPWTLPAYLAEQHALVAPRGTPRGTVDEVLESMGHTRRVARTFPAFLPALWHVAGSDDLLTVSARLVDRVAGTLGLVSSPPPIPCPAYSLSLVWHPRVDQSQEDAWFRGVLVDAARGLNVVTR